MFSHEETKPAPRPNSPVQGKTIDSSGADGTNLVVNEEAGGERRRKRRGGSRNAWNDGIQLLAGGESEAR